MGKLAFRFGLGRGAGGGGGGGGGGCSSLSAAGGAAIFVVNPGPDRAGRRSGGASRRGQSECGRSAGPFRGVSPSSNRL